MLSILLFKQSPENAEVAADLIQSLALSFASVGKEYRLFETLYHSLRNRGVEFKKEEEVDIFTPNLSEEPVQPTQTAMHARMKEFNNVIDQVTVHPMQSQKMISILFNNTW